MGAVWQKVTIGELFFGLHDLCVVGLRGGRGCVDGGSQNGAVFG